MRGARRRVRVLGSGLVTLAAALVGATPTPRAAAETSSSLAWERGPGAESCIPAGELAAAVERLLGQRLAGPDRAATRIEGRISRVEGGSWQVEFELFGRDGASGQRSLVSQAPQCRELDPTLALVVALMVDPTAALGQAPPETPRATAPPLPPPRPEPGPSRPVRGAGASGPVVGVGRSEGASFGLRAAASIAPPRFWPIELGVTAWARERLTAGSASASLSMLDVSLGLAPRLWGRGRWELSTGLGVALGMISAQGFDLSVARHATALTVAFWVRGRVEVAIAGRLRAFLGLGLEVPAIRPRVVYHDAGGVERLIAQPAEVAGVAELGLALRFDP